MVRYIFSRFTRKNTHHERRGIFLHFVLRRTLTIKDGGILLLFVLISRFYSKKHSPRTAGDFSSLCVTANTYHKRRGHPSSVRPDFSFSLVKYSPRMARDFSSLCVTANTYHKRRGHPSSVRPECPT